MVRARHKAKQFKPVAIYVNVIIESISMATPKHIVNRIINLLETEFPNGIRPYSTIDCSKLRRLYYQHFDEELPETLTVSTELQRVGVVHEGKVFPRPSSKDGGWRKIVEGLIGQGHTVFQFSRLMELYAPTFIQLGIRSSEMLRETVIREAQDVYEISGNLFGLKGQENIVNHIVSVIVSQEGAIVDMREVSKKIPYVDMDFLRTLCLEQNDWIRNDQDSYAIVSRVAFDEVEISRGSADCEMAVKTKGFFSLLQLRLDNSSAMNDRELTNCALRGAFFQRFLSDRFDIHGQIVCVKGASVDGQLPIRLALRGQSDISLEQIGTLAKEYNIAPYLALKAAHEEMVRVDRERFVAPALIRFDAPCIDKAIADVCEGNIMPFGVFNNFSDFPAVPGFTWNYFLLEAFLRRASIGFHLVSPSVPAIDVSGAVVPRAFREWSAEDAFATLALRYGVGAELEAVGDFLVAKRCILRRSQKTVWAVVSRMKELEKC